MYSCLDSYWHMEHLVSKNQIQIKTNKDFEEKLKRVLNPIRIQRIKNKKNNIVKMVQAMLKERHSDNEEIVKSVPDKVSSKRQTPQTERKLLRSDTLLKLNSKVASLLSSRQPLLKSASLKSLASPNRNNEPISKSHQPSPKSFREGIISRLGIKCEYDVNGDSNRRKKL